MFSTISLLLVVVLSMLVVRIATVALTLTGLSKELSRFQAWHEIRRNCCRETCATDANSRGAHEWRR